MSPAQQQKLQELSIVFSQGKANPKQIQQLSELLTQINQVRVDEPSNEHESCVTEPRSY